VLVAGEVFLSGFLMKFFCLLSVKFYKIITFAFDEEKDIDSRGRHRFRTDVAEVVSA
jgi:hypothetical protein